MTLPMSIKRAPETLVAFSFDFRCLAKSSMQSYVTIYPYMTYWSLLSSADSPVKLVLAAQSPEPWQSEFTSREMLTR